MARVRNRATRRDNNHKEIVKAFRYSGFYVLDISGVPNACDIFVSYGGVSAAIEIKSKKTAKLTEGELKFKNNWLGLYYIAYNLDDVADIIKEMKNDNRGKYSS